MKDFTEAYEKFTKKTPIYFKKASKLKKIWEEYNIASGIPVIEYLDILKLDIVLKNLIVELFQISEVRLKNIYPSEKLGNTILQIILLFLANPNNNDLKTEKFNLLKQLINHTQDAYDNAKYLSGKFSFLIVNTLYFFCNVMIYCLFSIVLLQVFENFSSKEIEKLMIEKVKVKSISFTNLQDFYSKKLEILNPRLKSAEPVVECCLPYIFEPIKDMIYHQQEVESVVISEIEIDEIINRIIYLFDPLIFMDVFLTLKIKDY